MDFHDKKQTWNSSQIAEFEHCLKKIDLKNSDDPVILVKNSITGKYMCGRIKNYKYEDTSAFWRDGASKWDKIQTGTLELPFPKDKKIQIHNVCSVIITWGKNHID